MGQLLTIFEHLAQLRSGIIRSLAVLLISFFFALPLAPKILRFLIAPAGRLVFVEPAGAFLAQMNAAFLVAVAVSSPIILYQSWRFVSEAFSPRLEKYIFSLVCLSFLLFWAGCVLGYCFMLPAGLNLLLGFAVPGLCPMISVSRYLSFVFGVTVIFGVIFQLPLIMVFLSRLGLVSVKTLFRRQREAVLIIFIAGALLSPPDVISQILVSIPLLVLYESGLFVSWLLDRRVRG